MLHFLYYKEEDVDYLAASGNDRQAKMNCTSFLMYTLQYNACYYYTYVSCAQKMHFQITFTQITLIHNVL